MSTSFKYGINPIRMIGMFPCCLPFLYFKV
jgi:hypothetical protein